MSKNKRKHKKLFIFLSMIVFGAFSGLAGYVMAQNEPRIVPKEVQADVPVGVDDATIAKDATVIWHTYYEMCGHTVSLSTEADEEMVGLSFAQLSDRYPEMRIVAFSDEEVELKKSYACYCPEHYILRQHEDKLAAFVTAKGGDEQVIYTTFYIDFDKIPESRKEALKIGRVFASFEDVEAYIGTIYE